MKKVLIIIALFVCSSAAFAQNLKWSAQPRKVAKGVYEIVVAADIPAGYHLYDFGPYEDGPMPTSIAVKPGEGVALEGKMSVPASKTYFDEMYGMQIGVYEGHVEFVQKVSARKKATATVVAGGMVCSGFNCQPPRKQSITVVFK